MTKSVQFAKNDTYFLVFSKNSCTFAPLSNTQFPIRSEAWLNSLLTNFIKFNIMAYVISDECIACGTCIDECPMGAISEGEHYSIDPEVCTECGTCADVCPSGAISK